VLIPAAVAVWPAEHETLSAPAERADVQRRRLCAVRGQLCIRLRCTCAAQDGMAPVPVVATRAFMPPGAVVSPRAAAGVTVAG
jgi:hypothetical protein